jgi:hypothetical protein
MFIKKIKPFIYSGEKIDFDQLVKLIKAHYEKEIEETDEVYSKIEIDDCKHLGRFIDELYFSFKDDLEYQFEKFNVEYKEDKQFLSYYFKELDTFKEKTNALFDKYYPKEDY